MWGVPVQPPHSMVAPLNSTFSPTTGGGGGYRPGYDNYGNSHGTPAAGPGGRWNSGWACLQGSQLGPHDPCFLGSGMLLVLRVHSPLCSEPGVPLRAAPTPQVPPPHLGLGRNRGGP